MDALSDVLSMLQPCKCQVGTFNAAGRWSIEVPQHDGISFYAVNSGHGWFLLEGIETPVHVRAGDCFMLPRSLPLRVTSDLNSPPRNALTRSALLRDGRTITQNGGGDFSLVGGHLVLTAEFGSLFTVMLPPVLPLAEQSDKRTVRWLADRMLRELQDLRPGSELILQHLGRLMLMQTVRAYLASRSEDDRGLMSALADRQITAALVSIHQDPPHRWTLKELACRAAMSRSAFAARFKKVLGIPPMEYVTRWRMTVAGEMLRRSDDSVFAIALSVGYESESAFGAAFKKIMGSSPRQFDRQRAIAASVREVAPPTRASGRSLATSSCDQPCESS